MKLRYAVIHLEGEAIQWHQAFMRTRGATVADLPWDDYVRAISTRFSNAMFEDPLEELALLSQTGSLKEYNTAFDSLLNKVTLSEPQAVSLYLKGLRDEIRGPVKMFKPGTLHEAYGLAKIQDLNNASVDKRIKMAEGSSGFSKGEGDTTRILPPTNASNLPLLATPRMAPNAITKPPQQRLTNKELEEKRAKGECFWRSEKYVPGHKCDRNRHQVYIIEAEEEDAQEIEPGIDTWETDHHISLHALTGLHSYSTMRVQGSMGTRQLHILIDSGSTHNFMDVHLAKKLQCEVRDIPSITVSVAGGRKLHCTQICPKFQWAMQGHWFTTEVLLIALENYDMILGGTMASCIQRHPLELSKDDHAVQSRGAKVRVKRAAK